MAAWTSAQRFEPRVASTRFARALGLAVIALAFAAAAAPAAVITFDDPFPDLTADKEVPAKYWASHGIRDVSFCAPLIAQSPGDAPSQKLAVQVTPCRETPGFIEAHFDSPREVVGITARLEQFREGRAMLTALDREGRPIAARSLDLTNDRWEVFRVATDGAPIASIRFEVTTPTRPTSFYVDNLATTPNTFITAGPPPSGTDRSARFVFGSNEKNGVHFDCFLDGAALPEPMCKSPLILPDPRLPDLRVGSHRFSVGAVDNFGARDPTPAEWPWTITEGPKDPGPGDPTIPSVGQPPAPQTTVAALSAPSLEPPDVTISGLRNGAISGRTTETFSFESPGAKTFSLQPPTAKKFRCSLDDNPLGDCPGGGATVTYPDLAAGVHKLSVQALDADGRHGKSATLTWLTSPMSTPVPRQTLNAQVLGGNVLVRFPGGAPEAVLRAASESGAQEGYMPLTAGATIPVGATVDATGGEVRLTSAALSQGSAVQTADFSDGAFQIRQLRIEESRRRAASEVQLLTELRMTGPSFASRCGRGSSRARARRVVRRLAGSGHGRFRTVGRVAAATVRGTVWLMQDRCEGTRTTVRRGKVQVRDFKRKRNVAVSAGQSYTALAPASTSEAQKGRRRDTGVPRG